MSKLDLEEKKLLYTTLSFAHPATIGCQISYDGLSIVRESDQPTDQTKHKHMSPIQKLALFSQRL